MNEAKNDSRIYVSLDDPRLTHSAALVEHPFADNEYLKSGDLELPLADKVFPLARVSLGDCSIACIAIDRDTPTAVFDERYEGIIRAAQRAALPMLNPRDPRESVKFQNPSYFPYTVLSGNCVLWLNRKYVALLRRDEKAPAASMPGHLMFAGGFWGGGRLEEVPLKEQQEEMQIVRVGTFDGERTAREIVLYHLRPLDKICGLEEEIGTRDGIRKNFRNLAPSLMKWHDVRFVERPLFHDLAVEPYVPQWAGSSWVVVQVNGKETERFKAVADFGRWKGDLDGRSFDGLMNVFAVTSSYNISIAGRVPEASPLFTGACVPAEHGDTLILDPEGFGRAGGFVLPERIDLRDKILPSVQRVLRTYEEKFSL